MQSTVLYCTVRYCTANDVMVRTLVILPLNNHYRYCTMAPHANIILPLCLYHLLCRATCNT